VKLLTSSRQLSLEEAADDPGFVSFKAEIDQNVGIMRDILAKLRIDLTEIEMLI